MQPRILFLGAAAMIGPWLPIQAAEPGAPYPLASNTVIAAQSAPMQEAFPLTLDKAIELALGANPDLRAAAQSIAIADGARQQAGLWRNPELAVTREGTQRANRTQAIQISQPLELGGKRAARIAVADLDRSLAIGDVQVKTAELRSDVAAAYFEALAAQERAELARNSLDLAQKASAAAKRRVTAGKISPVEETRSNVAAASARLELVQADANLMTARRQLAAMWGSTAPVTQRLSVPESDLHALPSLDQLLAQLGTSPQLQRAQGAIKRDEAQVQYEKTQRIPDVSVVFGNKKDYEQGRSQTVIGLSVPLPLFNRNQGNLLSALRRVDQAKAQLEADRLRLNLAVSDAYQRTQVSQAQVETMRQEILPAAQSALDAAVTGFELGKFNFLDVLDAQRTVVQTRAQYLSALSDRYRAMADIQRYVTLPDVIQAPHTDRNTK